MRLPCLYITALAAALWSSPASATPFVYQGQITSSSVTPLPVGTLFTLTWQYAGVEGSDQCANPNTGIFLGQQVTVVFEGLAPFVGSGAFFANTDPFHGCDGAGQGHSELRFPNWTGPNLPGFVLATFVNPTAAPFIGGLAVRYVADRTADRRLWSRY
jgi:hypothetical protein